MLVYVNFSNEKSAELFANLLKPNYSSISKLSDKKTIVVYEKNTVLSKEITESDALSIANLAKTFLDYQRISY